MRRTYHGSCHCGAVRFQCELDLAPPEKRSEPALPGVWYTSTFRCNCTMCRKTRFWKGFVHAADFRLLAGEDALADYQFGDRMVHHHFCSRCGVRPFARGHLDVMGGEFYAVNIACLDDASDEELADAPVTFEDGRNDAWDHTPAETRHL